MKSTLPNREWVTVKEAAGALGFDEEAITRALRIEHPDFDGAKKILGRWRIPRRVIEPQLSETR